MIVFHGTTHRRARRICREGFLPRKPSRQVWFAESRRYARGRAKTQARRTHDRAVVLTCDIDLAELRERLGRSRVLHKNRVIAIRARLPVTVLRSYPVSELPTAPKELASWVNGVLGLKPHKGVSWRHAGVERLSRWVVNRLAAEPRARIPDKELLRMAQQWLPGFFEGFEVDLEHLRAHRSPSGIEVEIEADEVEADAREDEALDCLGATNAKRRVRGLKLLAEIGEPELFDWCVMFLDDPSREVRVAALHTIVQCDETDVEVVTPLAESEDRRIRGAAIAALARHSGRDAPYWFERGLKDPQACVRLEAASLLSLLDPARHKAIFELALYDPNPQIAKRAAKLAAGKGFGRLTW